MEMVDVFIQTNQYTKANGLKVNMMDKGEWSGLFMILNIKVDLNETDGLTQMDGILSVLELNNEMFQN